MNRCDRFESEALLAVEAGQTLPAHFAECADCRARAAQYRNLTDIVKQVDVAAAPRPDWRQRVLSRIDAEERRPKPHRNPWLLFFRVATPLAAVAALAYLFLVGPSLRGPSVPAIEPVLLVNVRPAMTLRGGTPPEPESARVGDVVMLEADAISYMPHSQLRLYRNETEAVLSCDSALPCTRTGDIVRAESPLLQAGTYQPALFLSPSALPAPGGDMHEDIQTTLRAGGRVILDRVIEVD